MRGKYYLQAAAIYLATVFALYNRRRTVDSEKEMKKRKWYTSRKGITTKEDILRFRTERLGAIDADKYKLEDEFKKAYVKQTYVR